VRRRRYCRRNANATGRAVSQVLRRKAPWGREVLQAEGWVVTP
jgi:hypothetical protein